MVQNSWIPKSFEQLPPHFFGRVTTRDADTHGRSISGWRGSYEHVGLDSFRGEILELRLWPIQIIFEHLDQPCLWRGSAWQGALVFVSLGALAGNLSFGGRAVAPSTVNVLACDFANPSFNNAPLDSITLAVKESALAEHAQRVFGRAIPLDALRKTFAITDSSVTTEYHECLSALIRDISANPAALEDAQFCASLKERVLTTLVEMLAANLEDAQQLAAPTTRSYVVDKAMRYIDSRIADAFEMVDLCRAIRVCPRTLRYSFQEMLGVSPTHYLLATRLGHVRRALLKASATAQVQFVAARYGFAHMGRFARYYSDRYGERPSDTLKRNGASRNGANHMPVHEY